MTSNRQRSSRPLLSKQAIAIVRSLEELQSSDPVMRVIGETLSGKVTKEPSARLIKRWRRLAAKAQRDLSLADICEIERTAIVLIKRGLFPI